MHGSAITMSAVRNEPVRSDAIPTTSGPSDALTATRKLKSA